MPSSRSSRAASPAESPLRVAGRWISLVLALLLVAFIGLSITGRLTIAAVRSEAMVPTLEKGDRLLSLRGGRPEIGDIVVFRTRGVGNLGDGLLALRVAGRPGDRLELRDGILFVNDAPAPLQNAAGRLKYRSFATASYLNAFRRIVTVPSEHYFFLSDHPTSNNDSRFWGFVPAENLRGRVRWRLWPLARWGAPE
ncbi:MAG: signal peptidase I [Verrucomicrobia bacterium]|nr:signal peptidase I [Verrucomicrobiota bacterium]